MERFQGIDARIQEGYGVILDDDCPGGCDIWLEAWDEIKSLFTEGIAEDIYDLDDKYTWTEYISNYVQDLDDELHNAGLEDKRYHKKRAEYCQELLQWCGADDLMLSNTRSGVADGYLDYGDIKKGEQLYTGWLQDDPDWGWGYVGFAEHYCGGALGKNYEEAEGMLLAGYARTELRNKIAVVDRLVALYREMGKPEKAKEYGKVFSVLQRAEPEDSPYYTPSPIKTVKIGRNEPCPCGSGKKYKKCCGA